MKSSIRVVSFPLAVFYFCCAVFFSAPANAAQVFVPDNGSGTARVPILADYTSETPMQIINGLPFGSTIDIDAVLETPTVFAEQPGGSFLGGTKSGGGGGGVFTWTMQGTGAFAAYNRVLTFPVVPGPGPVLSFPDPAFNVTGADFEVNAAPRVNNAPLQSFNMDLFRLFTQRGQPQNDPDFDLLRVVAGSDFGLPSPGHTYLLQTGPNWEVDSYFDMTYRIDFVGRVGGPFSGLSGSSTATVRISLGETIPEPSTFALVGLGGVVAAVGIWRRRRARG